MYMVYRITFLHSIVVEYTLFHAIRENIARVEGCIFTSLKDEWKHYTKSASSFVELHVTGCLKCGVFSNSSAKVPQLLQICLVFSSVLFALNKFVNSLSFSDSLESSSNQSYSNTLGWLVLLPTSAICQWQSLWFFPLRMRARTWVYWHWTAL